MGCLVKASHHIKGVCFIDDKNLNFKVFLNQKTGNAMSGVEVAFTTSDDDYDNYCNFYRKTKKFLSTSTKKKNNLVMTLWSHS